MFRHRVGVALFALASFPAMGSEWTGSGELGLAYARGNAESETLNARLELKKLEERWLYEANASALRASGEVPVVNADGTAGRANVTNANRWELGGKVGYRYTERLYFFGSGRYDKDDFASNEWKLVLSAGAGYKFIDTEQTKLVGEIGPGYRQVQPIDALVEFPPPARLVELDTESDGVVRGTIDFSRQLSANTSLGNLLLIESGGGNTFAQNDLRLQVQMNERFALKAGLQFRHNTDVPDGIDKTDTLFTTNIVVAF